MFRGPVRVQSVKSAVLTIEMALGPGEISKSAVQMICRRHFLSDDPSPFSLTMNLVDYSDSESRESEEEKIGSPPPAPKPHHATLPAKPAKKQIIVDLPKPSRGDDDDWPSKKRARPNGQGGGGLFSILPPPKRSKPWTNDAPKPVEPQVQSMETSGELIEPVETETPPAKLVTTTSFMPRSTQAKRKAVQPKQPGPAAKPAPISLFPLGPDLLS